MIYVMSNPIQTKNHATDLDTPAAATIQDECHDEERSIFLIMRRGAKHPFLQAEQLERLTLLNRHRFVLGVEDHGRCPFASELRSPLLGRFAVAGTDSCHATDPGG